MKPRRVQDEENANLLPVEDSKIVKIQGQQKSFRSAFIIFTATLAVLCVIGNLHRQAFAPTGRQVGTVHKNGTLAMYSTYDEHKSDNSTYIADNSNPGTAKEATVNEASDAIATEPITPTPQHVEPVSEAPPQASTVAPTERVIETPVVIATEPTPETTTTDISSTSSEPNRLPRFTREQLLSPIDLAANNHASLDYGQDDFSKISVLQKRFAEGRAEYIKDLRIMYGEYYEKMFLPDGKSVGHNGIFSSTWGEGKGWERFVMKMKLKLVQLQLKFLETENPTTTLTRFVHLHGGHSSAAGHGNLFDESYTAEAERRVQPVLRRIGINYIGKNYAMGGTPSGEEIGLCTHAIFGKEADIQSWDYGMMEGRNSFWAFAYAQRAAQRTNWPPGPDPINDIPSRPVILGIQTGQKRRHPAFTEMDRFGITALTVDDSVRNRIFLAIPDTQELATEAEIEALPTHLRRFKCNGQFENGALCKKYKYNMTVCASRTYKASWHPGWKSHAVDGNLLAMTILDGLEEAMEQLALLEPAEETKEEARKRLLKLFNETNADEHQRYDSFSLRGPSGARGFGHENYIPGHASLVNNTPLVDVMHARTYCHTARMPAESRFRGLVTENFEKTTINAMLERRYDEGFPESTVLDQERKGKIVTNPEPHRQNDFLLVHKMVESCEKPTFLDNKDSFFVSSLHGWKGLTLPNDSEKQFYTEFDMENSHGWIMVCLGLCPYRRCAADEVQGSITKGQKDIEHGWAEMTINDVPVKRFVGTGGGCHFASHSLGANATNYVWKADHGQYRIQARVTGGTGYGHLRFSSFIFL